MIKDNYKNKIKHHLKMCNERSTGKTFFDLLMRIVSGKTLAYKFSGNENKPWANHRAVSKYFCKIGQPIHMEPDKGKCQIHWAVLLTERKKGGGKMGVIQGKSEVSR